MAEVIQNQLTFASSSQQQTIKQYIATIQNELNLARLAILTYFITARCARCTKARIATVGNFIHITISFTTIECVSTANLRKYCAQYKYSSIEHTVLASRAYDGYIISVIVNN